MIIISDTTPIISLLKADQLELLQKLYKTVLVPRAVYRELTENPAYIKEAEVIKGESEAIIMYDEQKADLLLMDEHKGRNVAKQLKVRYIGTAGILMLAYDKGIIQASTVKECIDLMLANGIRLGKNICNTVMVHVGLDGRY